MSHIVTLTTDFGSGSGYVAEVKGRLLHARQPVHLVDIAHDLPPHDIRSASWLIGQACFTFPPGSLHLVVVDPGVGTLRRLVWARIGGQEFLCPDNGLLSWALRRAAFEAARTLTIDPAAAATFHGRDVLAPAAVRLLDGADPAELGPPLAELRQLSWPELDETPSGVRGEVIQVDAFGNLITNLPANIWPRLATAGALMIGSNRITRLVRTYGDAPPGSVVVLVGSQGFIEAAVVEGRADLKLAAGIGTPVSVG